VCPQRVGLEEVELRVGDEAVAGDGVESAGRDGAIAWERVRDTLRVDRSVGEVAWLAAGESAAREALRRFVAGMRGYATDRNDPTKAALSNLSSYLRFGQLAPQRAALDASAARATAREDADAFLEELIVRRELSDNFCFYNPDGYDRLEGLYPSFGNDSWAQRTLRDHAADARPYTYSREDLERARTHDELWNAAQDEMVLRGKMHGFLRMYWAKKILEWTPSPQEALDVAIFLNDKYELDGRDPNGYVGCAWAIAGLHDQGWAERAVFGKIRYMNFAGCSRKFDVRKYVRAIRDLRRETEAADSRE
jgi:deoxyribodipyrimidine photo-lyase